MSFRNICLLTFIFAASGCASQYSTDRESWRSGPMEQPGSEPVTGPGSDADTGTVSEAPRPVILPTATTAPAEPVRSLPAATALRDRATTASVAGDHRKAISLLERALRISPQDPETFLALAQNNLAMDQPEQAIQLARRGLTLNPTDRQRQTLQNLVEQAQAAQQ